MFGLLADTRYQKLKVKNRDQFNDKKLMYPVIGPKVNFKIIVLVSLYVPAVANRNRSIGWNSLI